uniref:Nucleotide-diphospho-sugar transferase domain-containing protein n=1 Tax=Paramoeba aestuarina TaxID=180227 RepID=A0A7S4PA11_9EUKA|mmetsp:Transcript_38752/g.61388  ORF Transcript_38752/g.61388 Transcript_38752/m.61388 type:complete len:282 (+) Transcript_38752:75-920(+)
MRSLVFLTVIVLIGSVTGRRNEQDVCLFQSKKIACSKRDLRRHLIDTSNVTFVSHHFGTMTEEVAVHNKLMGMLGLNYQFIRTNCSSECKYNCKLDSFLGLKTGGCVVYMDTDLNLNLRNLTPERMRRILEDIHEYCSFGYFYAVPDQKRYFREGYVREFNSGFLIYHTAMFQNIHFESETCINDQVALTAFFDDRNFSKVVFLPSEWNCMPKHSKVNCDESYFLHQHGLNMSYINDNFNVINEMSTTIEEFYHGRQAPKHIDRHQLNALPVQNRWSHDLV